MKRPSNRPWEVMPAAVLRLGPLLLVILTTIALTAGAIAFAVRQQYTGEAGLLALALAVAGTGIVLWRQRQDLTTARREQVIQAEKLRALQLLEDITNGSTDAIFAKDAGGRYLLFNWAAARMTGRTAEEVLGRDDTALFPPDQAALVMANDRRVMAENRTFTTQVTLATVAGERIVLATKGPLHGPGGEVIGLFGISHDITQRVRAEQDIQALNAGLERRVAERTAALEAEIAERKQVEERLRETERRWKHALDSAAHGVWDWNIATSAVEFSATWKQMLGFDDDDIQGDLSRWLQCIHPEDLPAAAEAVRAHLEGRTPRYESIFRVRDKEGGWRWILGRGMVFERDAAGKPLRMLGTHTDITDQRQAQERLRQSEDTARRQLAEIQAYYDTAPVGLCVMDTDLRFVRLNERIAEMNGLPLAAHPGRTLRELVPDVAKTVEPLLRAIITSGEPLLDHETIAETPAQPGIQRAWRESYFPLKDLDGRIIGINVFVEDITERKRAEAELRRSRDQLQAANAALAKANRLKDEFLASMSHELRTPLTAVLGLTEALQEDIYGPVADTQRQPLKMIEDSGRHLLALINDILDLARIEAGQVELVLWPCALMDVGQASLHLVKGMANKKRQQLTLAVAPPDLAIEADGRRLKQMLVNLLGNAVKFTPDGGRIGLEIAGDPDAGVVRLAVWDTGIGIAAEDLPKLFQTFVQLDARLERLYAGTGLGLVLVKRMAELHGGTVSVESAPGQGSRFTITLPWKPPAPAGA